MLGNRNAYEKWKNKIGKKLKLMKADLIPKTIMKLKLLSYFQIIIKEMSRQEDRMGIAMYLPSRLLLLIKLIFMQSCVMEES